MTCRDCQNYFKVTFGDPNNENSLSNSQETRCLVGVGIFDNVPHRTAENDPVSSDCTHFKEIGVEVVEIKIDPVLEERLKKLEDDLNSLGKMKGKH